MALLSQGTTSRHKHIFKGDCCQPPLNTTRNSEHFVQSSLKQSLLPVSKSERSSSSVRWTSSFKVDIKPFILKHLSRKKTKQNNLEDIPSSHHRNPTVPSIDFFFHIGRRHYRNVQSPSIATISFLFTRQTHILQKQTTRSIASFYLPICLCLRLSVRPCTSPPERLMLQHSYTGEKH